jgi:hypothetical protein
MKKIGLIAFCLIALQCSFGQSYPADKEKFVRAFQSLTSEYVTKEQKQFITDELELSLVKNNTFPDKYFNIMVTNCNLMESKKLKAYPDIFNYVFSVYSFVKNKQPESSFNAWQASVDKLLDSKNIKKFSDFIETSASFFSSNALVESANEAWFAYGNYAFEFVDKPIIRFTDSRIVCGFINKDFDGKNGTRFLDSVVVYHTSGTFDPILKKWDGKGGTLDWTKVGLNPAETFVELSVYDVNMKSQNFSCDSVLLTSPYFPGKKVYGKILDKAIRPTAGSSRGFPVFTSFDRHVNVKEIRPQMDYTGGFVLEGNKLLGQGTEKEPANLTIYKNSKPFMICNAQSYVFSKEEIYSPMAKIVIRINDKDTLSHPGIDFRYLADSNRIDLTRGAVGITTAPFRDTYHNLDHYVPVIQWVRSSNDLVLGFPSFSNSDQRVARFESGNYYDAILYDRLQGVDQNHPLALIYTYCYRHDEFYVPEGTIATALGKTVEQCRSLILELASYGFLSYDSETRMVNVNQKTENFVKARSGRMDYDNLMFVSDLRPKTLEGYTKEQIMADENLKYLDSLYLVQSKERKAKKNFGTYNLTSMEMRLESVDQVRLSDIQASFVLPENGKVVIKQNRNFDFSGWVNAGKVQSKTKVASYDYAANKIFLTQTDETTLKVRPLKKDDGTKPILMGSSLKGVVGEILIDAPNNRAGAKADLGFPKLISSQTTKIYYNDKEIYKGAYDSTRFYYKVDPFTLDSLDDFSEKSVRLSGELTSAGIFPNFRQDLKIMPDYSFGFKTETPETGYVFYGTKAKYNDSILLSNNGLQGKGAIDFIQSHSESIRLFTFLPDSTVGFAKFENKPLEIGVQYPDVSSPEAYITYIPKKNVLKAASTKNADLAFFKGEAKLKGLAIIQATGMTGMGIISMQKAQLGSDLFKFKRWDVDADTSIFNLTNPYKEEGESDLAMSTSNFSAHVSFKERKGEFKSNAGEQIMTFDVNQYICKMDMFNWLMDQDELEMSAQEKSSDVTIDSDLDLVVPNLFSINPKQDSLQFRAPKAKFSQKEKTIVCSKTEYIDVADARIFPDSMKVVIRKKAEMDPLLNSKIVANYITKYHTFTKADTKITARRNYTSKGIYPYYDADSVATLFVMDKIGVDSSYQTIASGMIKDDANFKLSSQFDYYGKVDIKAANPLIYFSGATRINHSCEKFARSWMSFTAEINPKNIQIPVTAAMKSLDGQNLAAGIVWHDSPAKDSIRLYPTFLSVLESPLDPILMSATGLLQYDFQAKEFQISSNEKFANRNVAGNFLALNTETCSMNGDGKINLGMDYGDVTVDAVGTVSYDQTTGITDLNTTMRFNLPMDKGVWENLGDRIIGYEGSKPIEMSNTTLELALVNWEDQKTADKVKTDYTLSEDKKLKRVPDSFDKSIVITGVRLKSTPTALDLKGLMSSVEGAGVVNFYGKGVMRQVIFRAFFEQIYSLNGDHFAFNMDVPGGSYYLFDYAMDKKDGKLSIYTSDSELSAAITAIKEDKRKEKNFYYEISTNSVLLAKLNRIFE